MIGAVVVAFFPDARALDLQLKRLVSQVSRICIVDNTPSQSEGEVSGVAALALEIVGDESVELLELGCNQGVGAALNVGIRFLMDRGVDQVLLCDQDSLPDASMVAQLCAGREDLWAAGRQVAAVGPTVSDTSTGITFPFQSYVPGKYFHAHCLPSSDQLYVSALTIITSGTLVSADVLRDVGLMDESLFVDGVDLEWCHRARSMGYEIFGVGPAMMQQTFGEGGLKVWYLRWRYEPAYPPLRVYYRVRNHVALCKRRYINKRWKLRGTWYIAGTVYSHVLFGSQRWSCCKMSMRGFIDGLRGRMGAYKT